MEPQRGYLPVDGGRIWYSVVGSGGGVPLLVIHGIPGSSSRYLSPLSALAFDRTVIFYDQLGGGASDRPADSSLWSLERFRREVATVRHALALTDVHILGHSWGGMLACEHAHEGAGIRSLTLTSAPLDIPAYVADIRRLRADLPPDIRATLQEHESLGNLSAEAYQHALMAFRARHFCRVDPWPDDVVDALSNLNTDVFVMLWGGDPFDCTGSLSRYSAVGGLQDLDLPVLVTVGRYDATTPERASVYTAALPSGVLSIFEHSAHLAMWEQSEDYIRTIRSFLQRCDATA